LESKLKILSTYFIINCKKQTNNERNSGIFTHLKFLASVTIISFSINFNKKNIWRVKILKNLIQGPTYYYIIIYYYICIKSLKIHSHIFLYALDIRSI